MVRTYLKNIKHIFYIHCILQNCHQGFDEERRLLDGSTGEAWDNKIGGLCLYCDDNVQESSSMAEDSSRRSVRWLKRPDGGAEWEHNFAVDTLYGTSSASSNRIDKVRVRMLRFESLNVTFD